MYADITSLVAQVGFPMAVAIFMLSRTDKRLDALTQSINELNNLLRDNLTALRADRRDRPSDY